MQVQKLRLQRGWSQQQLAELSGLSVRTIQRVENGKTTSTETLKSLASVFEIDFQQLQPEVDMHTITSDEKAEQLAFIHIGKIKGFYIHLMQYVFIIIFLCVINLITSPHFLWFIFPALGWGIGILSHAVVIFGWFPFFGPAWEKRQVEKRLGRPL